MDAFYALIVDGQAKAAFATNDLALKLPEI